MDDLNEPPLPRSCPAALHLDLDGSVHSSSSSSYDPSQAASKPPLQVSPRLKRTISGVRPSACSITDNGKLAVAVRTSCPILLIDIQSASFSSADNHQQPMVQHKQQQQQEEEAYTTHHQPPQNPSNHHNQHQLPLLRGDCSLAGDGVAFAAATTSSTIAVWRPSSSAAFNPTIGVPAHVITYKGGKPRPRGCALDRTGTILIALFEWRVFSQKIHLVRFHYASSRWHVSHDWKFHGETRPDEDARLCVNRDASVAVIPGSRTVYAVDTMTGRLLASWDTTWGSDADVDGDGRHIVVADCDKLCVFRARELAGSASGVDGRRQQQLHGDVVEGAGRRHTFTGSPTTVSTRGGGPSWSWSEHESIPMQGFEVLAGVRRACAMTGDGRHVIAARNMIGEIGVWQCSSGALVGVLGNGHGDFVRCLAIDLHGSTGVSVGNDGTICSWRLQSLLWRAGVDARRQQQQQQQKQDDPEQQRQQLQSARPAVGVSADLMESSETLGEWSRLMRTG